MTTRKATTKKKAAAKPQAKKASKPAMLKRRPRAERGGKAAPVAVRLEPAQLAMLRGLGRVRAGGASACITEGLEIVLPKAIRTLRTQDPEEYAYAARTARRELERILEGLAGSSTLDEAGAAQAREALEALLSG